MSVLRRSRVHGRVREEAGLVVTPLPEAGIMGNIGKAGALQQMGDLPALEWSVPILFLSTSSLSLTEPVFR